MKKCSDPNCDQNAELVLDGNTRVVPSFSASHTSNPKAPAIRNVLIRTHVPSEFCYFHNKQKEKLL